MKTAFGVNECVAIAIKMTERAANIKDYKLTTKSDRVMKQLANALLNDKGYVIATAFELEKKYPKVFKAFADSKKMIWAIHFNPFVTRGNKMTFIPIR